MQYNIICHLLKTLTSTIHSELGSINIKVVEVILSALYIHAHTHCHKHPHNPPLTSVYPLRIDLNYKNKIFRLKKKTTFIYLSQENVIVDPGSFATRGCMAKLVAPRINKDPIIMYGAVIPPDKSMTKPIAGG